MPLNIIKSQKNSKLLLYDGSIFYFHRELVNHEIVWRCAEYFTRKCRSRCCTTSDEEAGEFLRVTEHNSHAPKPERVAVKHKIEEIKKTAEYSTKPYFYFTNLLITRTVSWKKLYALNDRPKHTVHRKVPSHLFPIRTTSPLRRQLVKIRNYPIPIMWILSIQTTVLRMT